MRRVASESRLPGQAALRRCQDCDELLPARDDGDRCERCSERPVLSETARSVGAIRQRERAIIADIERQIENIDSLLRRINRRIK
jgi:hypothetical protein